MLSLKDFREFEIDKINVLKGGVKEKQLIQLLVLIKLVQIRENAAMDFIGMNSMMAQLDGVKQVVNTNKETTETEMSLIIFNINN